jgi:ketosteroid isomerase-like protein
MNTQRAERIERFYEAFSRHDVDAILELCDEGVEIYKDPNVVEMVAALTPRGQERVAIYLRGWLDSWDMYRSTVLALRESGGDDIVALTAVHARGRGSQFDIKEEIADVFTFRGDRIACLRLHVTPEVALRDVGLAP